LAGLGHRCVSLDLKVRPRGRHGEHIRCDIASERDVARATERIRRRYGRVDNFVHGPYVAPRGFGADLLSYDARVWRRVLAVHVTGAMLMSRSLIPLMVRRRSGSIVFLGSIYGVVAPRFALYGDGRPTPPLVYSAAKAALVGMARWIAARYGGLGIRCNVVSPGGIDEAQWPSSAFKRRYRQNVPLGEPVPLDDLVRTITHVLESKHLTGHNLILDGGWTSV
jgi:NAD(P)-dependent dehydrogenase (short-subunit alcohol dehydrogenase family)